MLTDPADQAEDDIVVIKNRYTYLGAPKNDVEGNNWKRRQRKRRELLTALYPSSSLIHTRLIYCEVSALF